MFKNYFDVYSDLYKEYFFTPDKDCNSYSTISLYSFNPDIWQFPSRECINLSLEDAISNAKSALLFESDSVCYPPNELDPLEYVEQCTKTIGSIIPEAMRLLFGLPKPPDIEYIDGKTCIKLSDKTLMLQDVNRQLRNRALHLLLKKEAKK